jgi:DNA-binding MarR family transcriptional regulator
MDPKDIRTLKILEKVENDNTTSQRVLARDLGISLGLVNSFIKRLAKKGYFKVTHVPKNRIRYILTPQGVAEKSRLTYEYIQLSYKFYKDARKKLRDLYSELEKQGVIRIVFYGAGDLAEIAYISLQESSIELVAVVDDERVGKRFMEFTVTNPKRIGSLWFDKILITSINSTGPLFEKIVCFLLTYTPKYDQTPCF